MTNFEEICRSCLITDASMLSINAIVEDSLRIDECFRLHLHVEVSQDDELPPNICLECLDKLLLVKKFRLQCLESAQLLSDQLKKKRKLKNDNDGNNSEPENVPQSTIECIEFVEIDFPETPTKVENESDLDNDDSVDTNKDVTQPIYVDETIVKEEDTEYYSEEILTVSDLTYSTKKETSEQNKIRNYCLQCHQTFDSATEVKLHFNTIHATDNHNGKCLICRKKLPSQDQLMKHLHKHRFSNKIRTHVCPHCNRSFHAKPHFLSHLRTHTGERPFICATCGRAFGQNSALKTHMTLHNGKTVPCALCDKMFSRVSQLHLHMREHSGERPYACDFCPKTYRQLCHLKNHLMAHSGTKAGTCDLCGTTFTQISSLRKHMFTHTQRPYVCPKCPAEFIQKWRFRKHLTSSHDIHDDPNSFKRNDSELININEIEES